MPDVRTAPEVGMPCTVSIGSDRYAAEVVEIQTPRRIMVKERTGRCMAWSLRKDGNWRPYGAKGSSGYLLYLGHAEDYRDPSF